MKLRTQTLLFLFFFGLAPLLLLVSINMPLVLDRVEDFYHGAYLQNLRADFRDLDQHIASRHQMLRLLAKLPEPGVLMDSGDRDVSQLDDARATYVEWTNRILDDQLDVTRVVFTDQLSRQQFWLERDPMSLILKPTLGPPPALSKEFFEAGLAAQPGAVMISPIRVDRDGGLFNFLTLNLASPIVLEPESAPAGLVYITVDVGGMARAYANTLWVHDDGTYLQRPSAEGDGANAFEDFPGLREKFATRGLSLWESPDGRQTIWVPMFSTEDGGILWVGRDVDTSPLSSFERALVLRGLIVVVVVVLVIWMLASWFAGRAAIFGDELTRGIGHMLEDQPVRFSWRGTQEFRELGDNLTKLAEIHARNTRNLRVHTRELEESNRYKSEFLANVSHELRTPLNSILLLSKMLAGKTHLNPEEREQADVIHKAGQDLKDLIENILDLSRIEAGETTVTPELINLPQLLEDLLQLVRPQFDAKGLYLELETDERGSYELVSDTGMIRQILKNFLSNAVKFTDRGGARVRLRYPQPADPEELPVRIEVTDTGIGIPATKQKIIFEAFKQAEGSTNRRYGGTGLGLSISRDLARLLGGDIDVESRPGEGATFALSLPWQCIPGDPVNEPRETEEPPQDEEGLVPTADFLGATVLVIEHELGRLIRLAPLLESWNLRVVGAADLDEALEALAEERECRMVLLDIDGSAPDACDTIRTVSDQLDETGVVILMSTDCEAARQICAAGELFADCVPVPADPSDLHAILERHVPRPVDGENA